MFFKFYGSGLIINELILMSCCQLLSSVIIVIRIVTFVYGTKKNNIILFVISRCFD